MPRSAPHPDDRLLTHEECAERIHCAAESWWAIAKASPVLVAGKRYRGSLAFWTASSVAKYIDSLPREATVARFGGKRHNGATRRSPTPEGVAS